MSLGQLPIASTMVGVYNFDAGTSVDSSASPVNGTDTGIGHSLAYGKLGQGISISGASSYVTIADANKFSFTTGSADTPFTFACWLKPNNVTVTGKYILCKRSGSANDEYVFNFSAGQVNVNLFKGGSSGSIYLGVQSLTACTINVWSYVVVTYNANATNAGLNVYINGKASTVTSNSSGSYTFMANGTSSIFIGAAWNNTGAFPGQLDEIILDGREWTPAEIRKKYTQGRGKLAPM